MTSPKHKRSTEAVGHRAAAGFAWLVTNSLSTKIINFLGQIALAWLLLPSDFGKIGLAYTVTSFAGLMANPGLGDILMQRGRKMRLWSTAVFWMAMSLAFLAMLLVLELAPIAAQLYGVPDLWGMLSIMALTFPLAAANILSVSLLKYQLRYKLIAAVTIIQATAVMALTITFAALDFGAYSFVLPQLVTAPLTALAFWLRARPTVRWRLDRRLWRYLLTDSSILFAVRFLTLCVNQGDYVVLGLVTGSEMLVGRYFFAFMLSVQAVYLVTGNLNNVLYASLTRFRGDMVRQREAVLRVARLAIFLGTPLCLLQAAAARPGMTLVFGHKWDQAIPLVELLSIGVALTVQWSLAITFLQAQGRFATTLRYSLVQMPIFVLMATLGAWWGQERGVAMAVALFFGTVTSSSFVIIMLRHGVSPRRLASLYVRPMTLAFFSLGLAYLAGWALDWAGQHAVVQLLAVVLVGAGLYIPLTLWLEKSSWTELRNLSARFMPGGKTVTPATGSVSALGDPNLSQIPGEEI